MKHRYSSGMFCPICRICESSVGEDHDSSVLYQKVSRSADQQKSNFLFV